MERAKFVEVREAGVCNRERWIRENIQGLNIWGLRWRQLDAERTCYLVKGCYPRRESRGLMWGNGEGGQGRVGSGDRVSWAPFLLFLLLGVGYHESCGEWGSEAAQLLHVFHRCLQRLGNQDGTTADWLAEFEGGLVGGV